MTRIAFLFAALALLGACAGSEPAGYVPPSQSDFDANGPLVPLAFKPDPVVSSRSQITLF